MQHIDQSPHGFESFQLWVVSDMSRCGQVKFCLGHFGLFLGWVVSAYFGGLFQPNDPSPPSHTPPPPPPPIFYNINETAHNDKVSFMTSY